jgi:hypothetical protein
MESLHVTDFINSSIKVLIFSIRFVPLLREFILRNFWRPADLVSVGI